MRVFQERACAWWLLACLLVLAQSASGARQMSYKVRILAVPPGGEFSRVVAINNKGQIVGSTSYRNPDREAMMPLWHPVLWHGSKVTDLGLPDGVTYLFGVDINDCGQIAAASYAGSFILTKGKFREIKGPADAHNWAISAINNNGQVAGAFSDKRDNIFIWHDGRTKVIPVSSDPGPTWATGLNNHGQIVTGSEYGTKAWVWTGSRMRMVQGSGPSYVSLQDINDSGWAIGLYYRDVQGQNHPFLWRNGKITMLKTPGRLPDMRPCAINNKGQIVGNAVDKDYRYTAHIWQDGVPQALPRLAPKADTRVVDLNDNGVILGCAADAKGKWHNVVWEPVGGERGKGRRGEVTSHQSPVTSYQ